MTPFDIERAVAEVAQSRVRLDESTRVIASYGDALADGFRRDFGDSLDMQTVGSALMVAAASLGVLTDRGGTSPSALVDVLAMAGESLIRIDRERSSETREIEGVLCEHVLTWHPVAEGIAQPVEVPLNEHVVWAPAANLGEFRLSTREVPPPADEAPEWCPHLDCHDRVHGDGVHTDEEGDPFLDKPSDPYEWPEVSGA